MQQPRSLKDILSGLIFIGIGLAFGYASTGYQLGTAFRMGPGYFPLLLAGVMVVLGAAIVGKGLLARLPDDPPAPIPWRGILLLGGAIVFFGATIRGLGLVPVLFVTVFAAAMASRRNTALSALVLAGGMTAFCVLIFSYGLGVTIPLVGPWLRF